MGRLLSGAIATSILALPAGALQFSVFSQAKRAGRAVAPWLSPALLELLSGVCASTVACFVQTPQEVVCVRACARMCACMSGGVLPMIEQTWSCKNCFVKTAPRRPID